MLLRAPHARFVRAAVGKPARSLGGARTTRDRRLRCVEEPGDLVRVAAHDLCNPERVVEADEDVGDEEAALREAGTLVRQRHGRLQPRCKVVREVADDGLSARFRFLERAELRAAADEGVPPESSALDRLEQERAAGVRAQPEVCPERGDQVSGYVAGRVHGRTKRPPAGGQVERNGLCAGVSPGAGSRRARSARTTRCEWRESSVPSG